MDANIGVLMGKWLPAIGIAFGSSTLVGCLQLMGLTEPFTTVTYKLDEDKHQWTKSECVVQHDFKAHISEMLCHEGILLAPPTDVEDRLFGKKK